VGFSLARGGKGKGWVGSVQPAKAKPSPWIFSSEEGLGMDGWQGRNLGR
jgi:hypothetical protein